MVHELLWQPFGAIDGLGLRTQQTPVGLKADALALGISSRLLSMFLDKELQLRFLELPFELLGAQRLVLLDLALG